MSVFRADPAQPVPVPGTGDDQGSIRVDGTDDKTQLLYANVTALNPTGGGSARSGGGTGNSMWNPNQQNMRPSGGYDDDYYYCGFGHGWS